MELPSYCLSFHAGYLCAHAGACCTAGWPIPLERDRVAALAARDAAAHTPRARAWIRQLPNVPGGPVILATTPDGACVFYDDRLCAIQRDAGSDLMPTACRNFPRVTLRDPRGVFITLSHFCPTAARLLLTAGDIAIVGAPPTLSLDGQVEGLDADGVMPPLLRPGMLMDLDGYTEWEHQALAVLNDRARSARSALAVIRSATCEIEQWGPGGESLAARITTAFDRARSVAPATADQPHAALEHAEKAFLAAHVFASWAAYQQGGLAAVVDAVEHAMALLGEIPDDEATFIARVRDVDFRLRHLGSDADRRPTAANTATRRA